MEERDLGDTAPEEPEIIRGSWQDHDWTAEEITFVSKMLQHGNKSRAARETWPGRYKSPMAEHGAATRMLGHRHIREYLDVVQAEMQASMVINRERVLEEVAKLAYSNMADFLVIGEDGNTTTDFSALNAHQLAAIQEVEIHTYIMGERADEPGRPVKAVKFKLAPKLPALQLLGSNLKLWTDVVETNTTLGDQAALMRARRQQRRDRDNDQSED